VSSYQTGYSTGQDEAFDSASMSYSKLEWTYKAQKTDGSLEAGLDFKYDLKVNKSL
jgi:type VI protein secretion system component Hcp